MKLHDALSDDAHFLSDSLHFYMGNIEWVNRGGVAQAIKNYIIEPNANSNGIIHSDRHHPLELEP